MKELPATENALLLRTDFSDEAAWRAVSAEVQQPVDEFQANVTPISNPEYDGATPEQLLRPFRQAGITPSCSSLTN